MEAEIIAVGSEMLGVDRLDTNSLFITERLNALGVELRQKCVIGDNRARLVNEIAAAWKRSQIVILSGGLGPTEDDLTREAAAEALGRNLHFDQGVCDGIAERFRRFNRQMAEVNKRQAWVIDGAEPLANPNGTAPGQWLQDGERVLMLLPGPPRELKPLFTNLCEPRLCAMLPPLAISTVFFRVAGMGESDLDQLISPVYKSFTNPTTTILAGTGDIEIHLRAQAPTLAEADALVMQVAPGIEALLGDRIYSRNGDTLEVTVAKLLLDRGARLAVAESATGGLLGARITGVAGCSSYFDGGFLVYSDRIKQELLGVPAEMLAEHTAVSEPVAIAMAQGARARTGSTYAISVTGEAGPESATGQPVGVCFLGFAAEDRAEARRIHVPGDRDRIRKYAALAALDMLRRRILGL